MALLVEQEGPRDYLSVLTEHRGGFDFENCPRNLRLVGDFQDSCSTGGQSRGGRVTEVIIMCWGSLCCIREVHGSCIRRSSRWSAVLLDH